MFGAKATSSFRFANQNRLVRARHVEITIRAKVVAWLPNSLPDCHLMDPIQNV
jgi:hypothetical protein